MAGFQGASMRNPIALVRKHAPAYLLVLAVYALIFSVGWLMAMVHFSPPQPSPASQGHAAQERGAGMYAAGKLVVVSPEGCKYGEFNNRRAAAFDLATADCDDVLKSLDPKDEPASHRVDRIEAIGRYFRGTKP
jgi:hypothetical protein